MSGERHSRIQFTEQEILNFNLDSIEVNPPTLVLGTAQWNGSAWVKSPVGGDYPYEQYEWDGSGNVTYHGINDDISAADGDTDWMIVKFEYSGGNLIKKRRRTTSWTLRSSGW